MPVDLEDLAAGYAHRPASDAAKARARRAAESADVGPGELALDIGGGRGAHAAVWVTRGALAVVVDPSQGMTAAAAKRPGLTAVRAEGQLLPFRTDAARLCYFHLSIHYGDWRKALDEVARVLGPGGECWIWTMGEEHHRNSFLARWFPSVGDIDTERFPDPGRVAEYLARMGADVAVGREVENKVVPARQWRAAAEARFVSTLQLLSDDEFRAGLAAYDNTYPDPDQPVRYVLTFDWIRART